MGLPSQYSSQAGELLAESRKLRRAAQQLVVLADEAIHRAMQCVSQVTLHRRACRLAEKLTAPPERKGADWTPHGSPQIYPRLTHGSPEIATVPRLRPQVEQSPPLSPVTKSC